MREDVARDLRESAADFVSIVWPLIPAAWTGGGELVPVEAVTAAGFQAELDQRAGIDAWQLRRDDGRMRGIASRIQYVPEAWASFTVRTHRPSGTTTELAKRLAAVRDLAAGWLFPGLTIQAYLTKADKRPLALAVVRSVDLYRHLADHPGTSRTNPADGVRFSAVWWEDLADAGVKVYIKTLGGCVRPRDLCGWGIAA